MKKILRNSDEKILAGVCSGFADYFNTDPTIVRAVWIFFTLFGGSGILAYFLAILFIPETDIAPKKNDTSNDKNMDGTPDKTVWYFLLIVVGLFLLIQHNNILSILWSILWGSGFNVLVAVLVVVTGIYFLGKKDKSGPENVDPDIKNKLHLSQTEKKILGVCSGIGETFDIDIHLVRFTYVFGTFLSGGIGFVVYLLLGMILPKGQTEGDTR